MPGQILFQKGGGNATVPNDAPIQPPQAFVDLWYRISALGLGIFDFYSIPITNIDTGYFDTRMASLDTFNGPLIINFAGCSLSQACVDALLAYFASGSFAGASGQRELDLSGVNMATPTDGVANADAQYIRANLDWTVWINVSGVRTQVT